MFTAKQSKRDVLHSYVFECVYNTSHQVGFMTSQPTYWPKHTNCLSNHRKAPVCPDLDGMHEFGCICIWLAGENIPVSAGTSLEASMTSLAFALCYSSTHPPSDSFL